MFVLLWFMNLNNTDQVEPPHRTSESLHYPLNILAVLLLLKCLN